MSASQVNVNFQSDLAAPPLVSDQQDSVGPCSSIAASEHSFPEFPNAAYLGIGAEFAELYAQHYESPKEFFYFDFLMLMGTSLSGSVRADFGDLKTHPRLFGLKIGPSGTSKKSTSFDIAEHFVRSAWNAALKDKGVVADETEDFWGDAAVIDHSSKVCKIIPGAGSAEGILPVFRANKRILVYFDEFDRFEKKAGTEHSVLGTMFNELFERLSYSNYTAQNSIEVAGVHLGMLSNVPLDQFESMASSGKLSKIGFWNRFTFVISDRRQKCHRIVAPSPGKVRELVDCLARYLAPLYESVERKVKGKKVKVLQPKTEVKLQLTAEARERWAEFEDILGTGSSVTRLDTIGMRLMAILAVTSGKTEIDLEVVEAVLAFLQYQETVRENYRPSQAQNPVAKMQEALLRALRKAEKPLSDRDLRRAAHADDEGEEVYQKTRELLRKGGRIKVAGSNTKGKPLYELTAEELEED